MGPVKFLYNSRFDFTENSLVTNTVFITRVLHTFMSLDQLVRLSDCNITVKTLNIGTPRPATVVVLNIKPFNFTMK